MEKRNLNYNLTNTQFDRYIHKCVINYATDNVCNFGNYFISFFK